MIDKGEEVMISNSKHFTDTIFYQIELTARYTKMLGMQLFGKLGVGLTIEEFAALDTISANEELCQRDLAKLILKMATHKKKKQNLSKYKTKKLKC